MNCPPWLAWPGWESAFTSAPAPSTRRWPNGSAHLPEPPEALMKHHPGFLADILASPDDDAPRLVYADWLDENGQPERAEFIRLQCELANMSDGDGRRAALAKRERQLLRQHGRAWTDGLPRRLRALTFRRGFLEPKRWRLTARQFLEL